MTLKTFHIKILYATLLAISMAYIESAVVVYLRELYYPGGFQFPLTDIPMRILLTEVGRETATIVLLSAYAKSIGRNGREVMAYFMYTFGIWDIWYYVWLKVLLNWPATFLDWDVLFLIPIPWVGPVLAPVIVSLSLIVAGYIILTYEVINRPIKLNLMDWVIEIVSGLIIILSFMTPMNVQGQIDIPKDNSYSWILFVSGLIIGWIVFIRRVLKVPSND